MKNNKMQANSTPLLGPGPGPGPGVLLAKRKPLDSNKMLYRWVSLLGGPMHMDAKNLEKPYEKQ